MGQVLIIMVVRGLLYREDINLKLAKLHNSLFLESSPGPVKYAENLLVLCNSETRLPLVEIAEDTKKTISDCLKNLSLI